MSDLAIQLHSVSKRYRLFRSKGWRMVDALGLPTPKDTAWDFWALRDVSLSLRRGERVGLIGRNGAGKSTLLKLIAGLIRPSGGSLQVSGRVTALMEMGTGFHPDLTGSQNVRASLAYLGVTGKAADKKTDEIIEFAELGDFIHHPFRIYSAGMQARLTFAVATSVEPDILIVDEILGAGDAYFSIKAAARMKDLTANGATLLLVSHDLASVQMMCDRAAWIDRGRLAAEGDTLTLCKSYMSAIRLREDARLKAAEAGTGLNGSSSAEGHIVTGRFVTGAPAAPKERHPIRSIRLLLDDREQANLRVGDARDNDPAEAVYLTDAPGYTNWSAPKFGQDNVVWREFSDEKGRYLHAPFAIRVPSELVASAILEIEHAAVAGEDVRVEFTTGETYYLAGTLSPSPDGAWRAERLRLPAGLSSSPGSTTESQPTESIDHIVDGDSYGAGEAQITAVHFFSPDDESEERRTFICGEVAAVEIDWEASNTIEHSRLVLAIYRLDGRCAAQVVSPASTRTAGRHRDRVSLVPIRLGPMEYIVSVGVFRDLHDEHRHGADPLHVLDRRFRLKVMSPPNMGLETGDFLHDATWQSYS
ncbi:ABC transporter ATP-binding protein [Bradyrhizobium sp. 6(2017)]|uniref:ABC transporter ATP-binding protein n=1 Tax=Bradyrhizobium sp. 6(2017) TaxID=1197460 RepID=UPI0013E19860|nr:ABC transporter ATP-binding protein [Bradyrhizobium sp. 6(2017)]QIG91097.1 ABC transporter ATP-binding protein [Bradyrhizobium sp. 6(2017)]